MGKSIDNWFCYQECHDSNWGSLRKCRPYVQNGYVQFLNEKAHSNILMVDLDGEKQIEKITLEALSCEMLAGLPGVTVAKTAE